LDETLSKISKNDMIMFAQANSNIVEESKDALELFESTNKEKHGQLRDFVQKIE